MNPQLMRWVNPMMRWLLRSPLHGVISRRYLLICVTGRKTGKVYQTPVSYAQTGDTLTLTTTGSYTWWKNLRGGAPIQAYLRGRLINGYAMPTEAEADVKAAFARVYPQMTPDQIEQFAPGRVAIHIQITP